MKKIVLLFILSILSVSVNSCASDDSGEKTTTVEPLNPTGLVSFKINGVTKNFNSFIMTESENTYHIIATNNSSIDDIAEFEINKNILGTQALYEYGFNYTRNTIEYRFNDNFASLITTNSNRQIIGDFAGDLYAPGGPDLVLTNGTINISY